MKTLTYIVVCLGMLMSTALASDVVAERKANFKANAGAMRAMGGQMARDDFAGIGAGANAIASWAAKMTSYFPEGSESIGARNEIWSDFETFTALAQKNQYAALAIAMAADAKDKAAIQQAIQTLSGTCKSCHSRFKN
ncbi:MAG: c-type cytochrome [Candidatus Puniceispirillaceae bacterium]